MCLCAEVSPVKSTCAHDRALGRWAMSERSCRGKKLFHHNHARKPNALTCLRIHPKTKQHLQLERKTLETEFGKNELWKAA